ncbi:hypothetical protein PBI_CJW1_89 [Mycobacterium phage Cjw1]|uniref:Uncharacterized protein n=3 Tax=Kostyavirus CJW1 TaxID=205869 RepID=Q857S2_9CAUD|nr:gp90 [Mycobacterium phage Cjw1]YP_008051714.1 hypothetical protein PBI_DUMBO_89 [Mycobacterium phage Dumbo]YP_008052265.1 hypothetical protein M039_gp091 [Mycobacterium phage Phaux]AOT24026.1 hypothetical protein SEA_PHARSALUS_86 [Mycobacterium phage Pharsalus]AQP30809.1 hypothetical protein SEA_MAXXINISTA_91 [Mycobacterium phage Maxxinista]AVO23578.1 hypothetical protein SEA_RIVERMONSTER_89 [Mycobacterium phage RiverMonster]AXH65498.1 hypothetical protein SEA_HOPEY_89 [Mycobacterium phage
MSREFEPAKPWIARDGMPIYPTASEFETRWDADNTFPFFEDEYGYGLFGYGHQDKAEFVAMANRYNELCGVGIDEVPCTSDDVVHCWAVVTDPRNEDDGIRFSWLGIDADTYGAWPLTWISY